MTVYQELQLNQAGSKKLIRSCTDKKEKRKHIAVYCLKIALTVAFCVVFVSIFTGIFGAENGVAVLFVILFVPVVDWLLDQFSTHSRQRVQRMEVREK